MRQQNRGSNFFITTAPPTSAVHFNLNDEILDIPGLTDESAPTLACHHSSGAAAQTDSESFCMTVFTGVELGPFIGLKISPRYALVDTRAQHGVLGPYAYAQIIDKLAVHGLKPRIIDTLQLNASGVGGTTKFTMSAEIPIGIKGVSGTLTIHLVNSEIPLLVPVSFCKQLGMVTYSTCLR